MPEELKTSLPSSVSPFKDPEGNNYFKILEGKYAGILFTIEGITPSSDGYSSEVSISFYDPASILPLDDADPPQDLIDYTNQIVIEILIEAVRNVPDQHNTEESDRESGIRE